MALIGFGSIFSSRNVSTKSKIHGVFLHSNKENINPSGWFVFALIALLNTMDSMGTRLDDGVNDWRMVSADTMVGANVKNNTHTQQTTQLFIGLIDICNGYSNCTIACIGILTPNKTTNNSKQKKKYNGSTHALVIDYLTPTLNWIISKITNEKIIIIVIKITWPQSKSNSDQPHPQPDTKTSHWNCTWCKHSHA